MVHKNLLDLHEAIVVALINQPTRTASFEEIAKFIEGRKLFPYRKENIPLATQVMLLTTKANGAYQHLFEQVSENSIKLSEFISENSQELKTENEGLKELAKRLTFRHGLDRVLLGYHENIMTSAAADLLINPNPVLVHGTEKGIGLDFKISIQNVIAIESNKRIKIIHLKEAVIPVEGGKPRKRIETNENFVSLLKELQGSGHHIMRASDKYAVNIYHYKLSDVGKFVFIPELPKGLDEKLRVIKTEKKFDRTLYHTRLMEIDRLNKYHHDISINIQKIEEINRYKDS